MRSMISDPEFRSIVAAWQEAKAEDRPDLMKQYPSAARLWILVELKQRADAADKLLALEFDGTATPLTTPS